MRALAKPALDPSNLNVVSLFGERVAPSSRDLAAVVLIKNVGDLDSAELPEDNTVDTQASASGKSTAGA